MRYVPCYKQIGISKDRYLELLHYCRQYPEWKTEAESLLGIRGRSGDGQPHSATISDPVSTAAIRREKLVTKITIVESCARAIGEEWYRAIIQNVCLGKPFEKISAEVLPTSNRNPFYKKRREFFMLLDEKTRSAD